MNGKAQCCKAVSGWDDLSIAMFSRLANAGTCLLAGIAVHSGTAASAGSRADISTNRSGAENPAVFGQHDAGRNRISGNKEQCPQPVPLKICAGDGRE